MFNKFIITKDKQQKHSKAHFLEYIYNDGDPLDYVNKDLPVGLEAELSEDSSVMRKQFRHIARKLRALHL